MDSYVHPNGGPGHSYLTTMPTDALRLFRDIAEETEEFGFDKAKSLFIEQGAKFRAMMKSKGFKSVAAPGFESPGVVVMYTKDATMMKKLKENGIQAAAGVPFKLGEESVVWDKGLGTFRIGLFGLDKIYDVPNTIRKFEVVIDKILGQSKSKL